MRIYSLYECVDTQLIECVSTLEDYIQAAASFVHCLHVLLLHPPGGNRAFGSSNGAPWPIGGLDFARITSTIANDIANESSHRINEVRRIESRKVLDNLRSQSSK